MDARESVEERVRRLVRRDPRYRAEAYDFVLEALDYAMVLFGKHRRRGGGRHLSVPELLEGMRCYALEQYGPLARVVLESMGILGTDDFGEVVFHLVEAGLLNTQESDDREQFRSAFSFREAFDGEG